MRLYWRAKDLTLPAMRTSEHAPLDVLDRAVQDPRFFESISPRQMENLLAYVLGLLGYQVSLARINDDGSRDLIADRTNVLGIALRILIVVRHHVGRRPSGASAVRSLLNRARQHKRDIALAMLVSSSGFTADARVFAHTNRHNLKLIGPAELMHWIVEARVTGDQKVQALAYRIARLPIAREFGRIQLSGNVKLLTPELLLPKLHLPPEYAERIVRVNQLPLDALRLISQDPRLIHTLTPWQFEQFIAEILDKLGFRDVVHTRRVGDGGRDVIASNTVNRIPLTFYFECKKYAPGDAVQLESLRALLGVVAHHGSEANIGVLVTTSRFTKGCNELIASECRLDGKDYDGIVGWIDEYQMLQGRF
jgi:HJR/Mrr/RecB family endonuclease